MARKYYTLLERQPREHWTPQFGDYNRSVVADEGDDMRNSGSHVAGTKYKIICTYDNQESINAKVAELNEGIAQ